MYDKKGALNLDVVKVVFVMILILAVIGVASILALSNMRDVVEDMDTDSGTVTNTTTATVVNETGAYVTGTSADTRNCLLTLTNVVNSTGSQINTANYSTSDCRIFCDGCDSQFNNTAWNLTGTYTYSREDAHEIMSNVSVATADFFSNTSTIYSILIIVTIILAIVVIVVVVNRFGNRGGL